MPSSDDESAGLVRALGRTILVVNVLVALLIFFLAGMESGPEGTTWHLGPIGAAIAFAVSGPFAWGILRGVAQIRDRIQVLVDEQTNQT
jgi:hypothetical protein